jgi:superfamily II RNA helicase
MTTEVLRNMLLQAPLGLENVQSVVLDEFHYLADPERGRVWEEIIILLPRQTQVVCLSATMSNANQLRDWVDRVHGETELVQTEYRPVPLEVYYYLDGVIHRVVDAEGKQVRSFKAGGEAFLRRRRPGFRQPSRAELKRTSHEPARAEDVVVAMAAAEMLPAIFFLFSRAKAEAEAVRCAGVVQLQQDPHALKDIDSAIEETLVQLTPEARELPQTAALTVLLRQGIAFHHAGLLPALKVLVETLFARGLIGAVFATETLALGINMPARSVVLPHLTKFDGTVHRPLTSREFHQMIGRAGRRGMDGVGNALLVYDAWMSFDEAMSIVRKPLEPVASSFALGYNSLVNLLLSYGDVEVLTRLMDRSLLAHQLVGRRKRLEEQLARAQQRLESGELVCPVCHQAKANPHCPAPAEHRNADQHRRTLHGTIEGWSRELEQARQIEERDLRSVITQSLAVLNELGYVHGDTCSNDAELLSRIVDANGLAVAELVLSGTLDGLSPADLAEVAGWLVTPDNDARMELVKDHLRELWRQVTPVVDHVRQIEQRAGVFITPGLSPAYPGLVTAWCADADFGALMDKWELAAGDGIRYFKKTADLLRQIYHALSDSGFASALHETAREAEAMVRRDIVRAQDLIDLEELDSVPQVEEAIDQENRLLAESLKLAREHAPATGQEVAVRVDASNGNAVSAAPVAEVAHGHH